MRAEVKFLGHVVSGEGVSTDPAKIEVVKDWPTPNEVRSTIIFGIGKILPTICANICRDSCTATFVNDEEQGVLLDAGMR